LRNTYISISTNTAETTVYVMLLTSAIRWLLLQLPFPVIIESLELYRKYRW